MPEFFVIAGEASGDMHASNLVKKLREFTPRSSFSGIGGKKMREAGVSTVFDIGEVNFIGFTSVISNLSSIRTILRKTTDEIIERDPAAVILVDFPGFNLRIAEAIRGRFGGKIIYYISPQVWAWHKSRVKAMKKLIDLLIVVFPFEVAFFSKEGMKAYYSGHPLIKRTDDFLSANSKHSNPGRQVCILPGSRIGEVNSMLPELIKAGIILKNDHACDVKILCAPHVDESVYAGHKGIENFELIHDHEDEYAGYKAILDADAVISKSGTSTLECALLGTPFLVVYRTGPLNYAIGKTLVDIKYISMVNILLNRPAVKEFLQKDMRSELIVAETLKILNDKNYREKMVNNFKELREILGTKDSSQEAAILISEIIGK